MVLPSRSDLPTHSVQNQPESGWQGGLWDGDRALQEAVNAFGGDATHLAGHGNRLGTPEMRALGRAANRHLPELHQFDQAGRRLDEVAFHPAYHRLLECGLGAGYAGLPWNGAAGGHVTHAAMVYLHSQIEPGTCCPMTMTYAAYPALKGAAVAENWLPKIVAAEYDPQVAPVSSKRAVTLGMAMTEKQGGSDVRSNQTRAERAGAHYLLQGHKWFCSAPMSDGFLTLAQTEAGLTCFLVPRWLEDRRNAIQIMRLKDKLGNRSNASAEIEYHGAVAHRVGDEGAGVATIIEMVHHTRLDTAMAPAGLMRAALAEAHHWACHRRAFGKGLIEQPLMGAVLAELALDAEAALWLGLRVARAFDGGSAEERAFARIAVALAKFASNKRCPNVIYEAMEALGGMGYVEDTPLPMLYREAPLNSIWEGSGNVICLDILRTLAREPASGEVLMAEISAASGADKRFDAALAQHLSRWPKEVDEAEARAFAQSLAGLLTASILLRHAPGYVAESFLAARLENGGNPLIGAAGGVAVAELLDRIGGSGGG